MSSYQLSKLADIVGGEVIGDGGVEITGVAGIKTAGRGEITFLAHPKYEAFLSSTEASAIIASYECCDDYHGSVIVTENPYLAFLKVVRLFDVPHLEKYPRGISGDSFISDSAVIGKQSHIGPDTYIGENVTIGERVTVLPFSFIGEGVRIGDDCLIYPNVTIREKTLIGNRVIIHAGAVIGSDGFGYAKNGSIHEKIPQIGMVVLEDEVEIGANSTIDRATTGKTIIRAGSKIDNLVQIAHNVSIGNNSIVAAQSGISGSTELGKNVILAGQSGLVGHISIGDNARVGAQGGVTKSIPPGTSVSGYPAREHSQARKIYACTARLPELLKEFRELKKKVERLENGSDGSSTTEDH
ncbi:MAG: UDP-3-O-(3-hydroxymyristoyl)glucosamine N-acyltransferase [Candidatus Latescibacteria bacterium]|nr:UDP-3-O-(3-hydroxymyristoyl)glucosamine N-acyltransferase [bacterium]MBD3424573.1 UDP-3-O-(3-hydroxymyristoyl)glucosamine N-acyltransferase [Candidatus Latescibacterota bacterium]